MSKRIELGEKVIGYSVVIDLTKGPIKVAGILKQRPSNKYEPYLIQTDTDPDGLWTPVYKIWRVRGESANQRTEG
jgi:hypothetical protein